MTKRILALLFAVCMLVSMFAGCGQKSEATATEAPAAEAATEAPAEEATAEATAEPEMVTLKCICDATPHAEILNAAADALAAEGIQLDIVSTEWSGTWNDMLLDGEVDFAYFMHVPAMESMMEALNCTLYSMGAIHVEPYTCFSSTLTSKDEIKEGAVIAVPDDASNEYRALKVLEAEGFITLDPSMTAINASTDFITDNPMNLDIKAIDQAMIIPSADDYDAYFVNVNRALEAGLDINAYLMRESEDSDYGNVITVTEANKDNEAIKKMVEVLKSDEIKQFILDNFNGAVIPAK